MVHQHFMLVPVLTVAENILLGEETMANAVFLDRAEAHRRIVDLGHRFGFEIDPEARVGSLSVGWQQRVEILKALYRHARILVLDEPTATLTPQETSEIFAVLRRLAAEGHSMIFISHKLYEVLEIADRITVIRRGRVVGTRIPSETNEDDLAEMMVGREVQLTVDRGESHPGDPALRIEGLRVSDDRGHEVVKGVDLEVRAGEILGVAGVAGNGQDELVEAITGLRKPAAGSMQLSGSDITGWSPRRLTDFGVGYVPGDRQRYGLVLPFPVEDNLVLTSYHRQPFAKGGVRNDGAIDDWATESIRDYDIRTPSATVPTGTLSGGNQQKVIVAREFSGQPRLLVLDPFVRLHRIDENASCEVAPLLAYLREMQRRHGVAVTVVHHAKKNGGNVRAGQALRGSSEFHAWGDSNLYLRRDGDDLSLSAEHRAAPSMPAVAVELAQRGVALALEVIERGAPPEPAPTSVDERITGALAKAGAPVPLADLRAVCRVRNATLYARLAALTADGRVARSDDGYRLAGG